MDDLGAPLFSETAIYFHTYMYVHVFSYMKTQNHTHRKKTHHTYIIYVLHSSCVFIGFSYISSASFWVLLQDACQGISLATHEVHVVDPETIPTKKTSNHLTFLHQKKNKNGRRLSMNYTWLFNRDSLFHGLFFSQSAFNCRSINIIPEHPKQLGSRFHCWIYPHHHRVTVPICRLPVGIPGGKDRSRYLSFPVKIPTSMDHFLPKKKLWRKQKLETKLETKKT